jgi:NAD-dependent SIR2 family protein deacetylase
MSFFGSATRSITRLKVRDLTTTSSIMSSSVNQADLESFSHCLRYSNRVLALCGAGLSAASGLPTFRGAGGLWRSHDAVSLATPAAFRKDPALVWQFYSYRRHMALQAQPNPAHYALAELARRKKGFLTLSQNVDGKQSIASHAWNRS